MGGGEEEEEVRGKRRSGEEEEEAEEDEEVVVVESRWNYAGENVLPQIEGKIPKKTNVSARFRCCVSRKHKFYFFMYPTLFKVLIIFHGDAIL